VREFVAFDDQVGAEDKVLVERVQRGVSSGLLGEGRLMGESERLIAHFDALVRDALSG
jgi:choline monooxygenase